MSFEVSLRDQFGEVLSISLHTFFWDWIRKRSWTSLTSRSSETISTDTG